MRVYVEDMYEFCVNNASIVIVHSQRTRICMMMNINKQDEHKQTWSHLTNEHIT